MVQFLFFTAKTLLLAAIILGSLKFLIFPFLFKYQARSRTTIDQIYGTLKVLIITQVREYERFLENSTDEDYGTSMTNSQFVNYYNDMCKHVIKSIPPLFYEAASPFLTEDAINEFVTENIFSYLAEKVEAPGGIDHSDDDEE
jgi:hypothetical protein